jgi:hypothetical protein
MQKHIFSVTPPKDERLGKIITTSTEASTTNLEVDKNYSQPMLEIVSNEPFWRSRRHRPQCAVLQCYCSCHSTKQISSRFWYIHYSPLADMLKNCDTATCTARRHRLQFRAALSQLGIPWAVILGVDVTLEVGKFTLCPALQLQRVVKYTSPGFEILWKLSEAKLSWDDAGAQFRELYRMDPTFCSQVDPSGRGYLEVGDRLFFSLTLPFPCYYLSNIEVYYRKLWKLWDGSLTAAATLIIYYEYYNSSSRSSTCL